MGVGVKLCEGVSVLHSVVGVGVEVCVCVCVCAGGWVWVWSRRYCIY